MTAWVFPGQGSQAKGMGKALFADFPEQVAKADEVLGYSVERLCLEDPDKQLGQTRYTQPALFVVNALSHHKKLEDAGAGPDAVAGHSLGEYNALLAAEVFDFETGLRLVKKRGELMSRAAGGAMAAVINSDPETISEILRKNDLSEVDVANHNSPSQIVISGLAEDVRKAVRAFKEEKVRCIPLKVSGAFHSRHMEPAREEFERFLKDFRFSPPKMPVVSNVTARPYEVSEIAVNLANQITHPVRWTESILHLMGLGETTFEEVGPGKVLTKLVEKIRETAPESPQPATRNQKPETRNQKPETRNQKPETIIPPESLGSEAFRKRYGLRYAYLSGAMFKGIASEEMVIRMGKAGMMGFFGTGGLGLSRIEAAIRRIQEELSEGQAYGMNLLANPLNPKSEEDRVDLFLRHGVRNVEAAAYVQMSPGLAKYRLKGLKRDSSGGIVAENRVMAKVSRPEIAEKFLSPAPERIVRKLLEENKITQEQAQLSEEVPMADDLCVESDSGGHTDQGIMTVLLPTMIRLRDRMWERHGYAKPGVQGFSLSGCVGAAGGIGTPEAAAAAFVLGADFILTGSVNQCTVEAGTSDAAKDVLQSINVQDTDYAPAGDMFETGAKVQVVRKGLFFPARANKLYDLYRACNSLDEIDESTRRQIQEKYFRRSFEEVYEETASYYRKHLPEEIERAERSPRHKMALIFRWYFVHTMRLASKGAEEQKVDWQIQCGPALGAFNQWVRGTELESWRNRHVDHIGERLMRGTAELLGRRFSELFR